MLAAAATPRLPQSISGHEAERAGAAEPAPTRVASLAAEESRPESAEPGAVTSVQHPKPKRARFALVTASPIRRDLPSAVQGAPAQDAQPSEQSFLKRRRPVSIAAAPTCTEVAMSQDGKLSSVDSSAAPMSAASNAAGDALMHGYDTVAAHDSLEDSTLSHIAFDPAAWTLEAAAVPNELRLYPRQMLADEHVAFLLQCLVPETDVRCTLTPAQAIVLLHGLQDDDVRATRDGRLSDTLSNPSITELFVPLSTTLLGGFAADAGSHWVLLHLDRCNHRPPTLWDSLPVVSTGGVEVARTFMSRLRDVPGWQAVADAPLRQRSYAAQRDGFQCGFFVALAARALAHGAVPQPCLAQAAADARRTFAMRQPTR